MFNIYKKCPIFKNDNITLRLTNSKDASDLLNCYSDKEAVPFFNADNCNGDTFYYTTLEQMKKAIDFWQYSYETKQFVRMTIIKNDTAQIIGTIEMFNRGITPNYGIHGVLRIDVMSKYEDEDILRSILELSSKHFYREFGVDWILTKAIESAITRRNVLTEMGYVPVQDFELKDYYGRIKK